MPAPGPAQDPRPGSAASGDGFASQPALPDLPDPAELGDLGLGSMVTVDLSDLQSVLDAARESDEAAGDPLGDDAIVATSSDAGRRWSPAELAGAVAEGMTPGPALGNWAACFAPGQLSDYALPGAAAACRRLASWAQAAELEIVAEVAARAAVRDSSIPAGLGGIPAAVPEEAAAEVALALRMSQYGASCWTQLAITLAGRLTGTGVALRAGTIDLSRARLIAEATGVLDDRGAAAAEAKVLSGAGTKTLAQLRSALRRAVIAVDPDAAERRREDAERRAKVGLYGDEDGTATLSGQNLPGAHAAAAMARVTALARALKSAGVGGGIDLLRAQVFIGLLLGTLPLIPPTEDAPPDPGGPDVGPPDSPDAGPPGRPDDSSPGRPDDSPPTGPDDPSDLGGGPGGEPGAMDPDDPGRVGPADPAGHPDPSPGGGPDPGDPDDPGPAGSGDQGGLARGPGRGLGPDAGDPDDPGPPWPDGPDEPGDPSDPGDLGDLGDLGDYRDSDRADRGPADTGDPREPGHRDSPVRAGTDPASVPRWPALPVPGLVPAGLARSGTGALAGLPRGPAGTGLLRLTVPWLTLARTGVGPGQLSRLGPVTPHTARRVAETAARDPATEWKVIVTDRDGQAIAIAGVRRTRARSPASAPAAGLVSRVILTVPAGLARDLAGRQARLRASRLAVPRSAPAQPECRSGSAAGSGSGATSGSSSQYPITRPGTAPGDLPVGPAPRGPLGTVLTAALEAAVRATARADAEIAEAASAGTGGCAHRKSSPAYRPPPRLREYVAARDQTCRNPVCGQPAHRADQDHTIPYHQGGRTCDCNLGGTCRTHHRLKQRPGWRLTQPEPGTFTWTTAAGRTYTQTPDPYPA